MKKILTKYAFVSAAMLAGVASFTACSSSDEVANEQVSPEYDPATNTVKTQFSLNIPHAATTRAAASATQADGDNFLGMDKIHMLEYKGEPSSSNATYLKDIQLAAIASSDVTKTSGKKVYEKVAVDVATSDFLFYGVSAKAAEDGADKFMYGSFEDLNGGLPGKTSLADINFKLEGILGDNVIKNTQATSLLAVLNGVAGVDAFKNATADSNLANLYASYTKLTSGSASSVLATLQDLYNAVESEADDAKTAIRTAITSGGTFTVSGDATSGYTLATTNDFPADLNLPDGAVSLKFSDGAFDYNDASTTGGVVKQLDDLNPVDICYPAPIAYFANSPVKANVSDAAVDALPTSVDAWKTYNWDGWTDEVSATTQGIALAKDINYGVGSLKIGVKTKDSKLQDNPTQNNGANTVVIPDGGLEITGIIVGGQPAEGVGYDYAPKGTDFNKAVYDKGFTGWATSTTTPTAYNYTILLPSKTISTEQGSEQGAVKFALEMVNNTGASFNGVDGKIPAGAKFYLVGSLDPNAATGVTTPDGWNDIASKAVIMSDYVTTANLTITSLASAYNVIPDLSSENMKLAFIVDLEWQAGLTFDIEIGK